MPQNAIELARRFLRGAVLVVIALAIAKAVSIYVIGRLDDAATRFTLRRILHLIVVLVIAVIVIGVVFVNWYAALISVGIGSGSANSDDKVSRLDIHSRTPAISGRRSYSNRSCYW